MIVTGLDHVEGRGLYSLEKGRDKCGIGRTMQASVAWDKARTDDET